MDKEECIIFLLFTNRHHGFNRAALQCKTESTHLILKRK